MYYLDCLNNKEINLDENKIYFRNINEAIDHRMYVVKTGNICIDAFRVTIEEEGFVARKEWRLLDGTPFHQRKLYEPNYFFDKCHYLIL